MKQFIARTIISLFTVFLFISCSPKEEFFEGYDFNSGDYVLYGLISDGDSTPLSNRVGDFIIRDTMVLNKIKHDWRIRLTDKRMSCGYTYIMILMKADSCVCHFAVNL